MKLFWILFGLISALRTEKFLSLHGKPGGGEGRGEGGEGSRGEGGEGRGEGGEGHHGEGGEGHDGPTPDQIWEACSGGDGEAELHEVEGCLRGHLEGHGFDDKIAAVAECLVNGYDTDGDAKVSRDEFDAGFGMHMDNCMEQVLGPPPDMGPQCADTEVYCWNDDTQTESCAPADTGCPCSTTQVKCIEEPHCSADELAEFPDMCKQFSWCAPSLWGCPPESLKEECGEGHQHCHQSPDPTINCDWEQNAGSPECWGKMECVAEGVPCPCASHEVQCIVPPDQHACAEWGDAEPMYCESHSYCEGDPTNNPCYDPNAGEDDGGIFALAQKYDKKHSKPVPKNYLRAFILRSKHAHSHTGKKHQKKATK